MGDRVAMLDRTIRVWDDEVSSRRAPHKSHPRPLTPSSPSPVVVVALTPYPHPLSSPLILQESRDLRKNANGEEGTVFSAGGKKYVFCKRDKKGMQVKEVEKEKFYDIGAFKDSFGYVVRAQRDKPSCRVRLSFSPRDKPLCRVRLSF